MDVIKILPEWPVWTLWIATIICCMFIIRVAVCFFKMISVKGGEIDGEYDDEDGKKIFKSFKKEKPMTIFKWAFCSSGGNNRITDYWIPALLGLTELTIYPIFMAIHRVKYIGFWLLIKTAAQWGSWNKSRTVYNRFLVGNILSLIFSYLIYYQFFLDEKVIVSVNQIKLIFSSAIVLSILLFIKFFPKMISKKMGEENMKKIISGMKDNVIWIFAVSLLMIAGALFFVSFYIPAVYMKMILLFVGLIALGGGEFLKQKKLKNDGEGEKVWVLICVVLFSGFIGFMLSEVSYREIHEKLDVGIDWQLTNAEILVLEKGVLGVALKSCWEGKTDDSICPNNTNYANGNDCYQAKQYQESNNEYELALNDARELSGDNIDKSKCIANIHLRMGFNYKKLDEQEKAIDAFRNSIEASEAFYNKNKKEILNEEIDFKGWIAAYLMLARTYAEDGKDDYFDKAYKILGKAKDIWGGNEHHLKTIWYHKVYVDVLKDMEEATSKRKSDLSLKNN